MEALRTDGVALEYRKTWDRSLLPDKRRGPDTGRSQDNFH